jgi:invasion protein IalB
MRMTFQIGLASLVALAVAATPAIAAAPTAAGPTSASADDNKMVCKGETRPNSRFKNKVCRTRAEWDQIREEQLRNAREFFDKPKINSTMGG